MNIYRVGKASTVWLYVDKSILDPKAMTPFLCTQNNYLYTNKKRGLVVPKLLVSYYVVVQR
jgi:hypothetical protein